MCIKVVFIVRFWLRHSVEKKCTIKYLGQACCITTFLMKNGRSLSFNCKQRVSLFHKNILVKWALKKYNFVSGINAPGKEDEDVMSSDSIRLREFSMFILHYTHRIPFLELTS